MKSLEPIIQLIVTDYDLSPEGWLFTGRNGSEAAEPLYGFTSMKQLYLKADPSFSGRYTVPVLWDKKLETIVNNESSEIIRMLYSSFDDFLEPRHREVNRRGGGFYPENLRNKIDEMNEWVYKTVNDGVYKVGFATSQEAYDTNIYPLFKSLDRLEEHLSAPEHQPYLFGEHITEADIRLYTTIARFDVAYHPIFLCNLKMIRHDYPNLSRWLRHLYWDESDNTNDGIFKKTTFFEVYKSGYLRARARRLGDGKESGLPLLVPRGPIPDIEPLTEEEEQDIIHRRVANVLPIRSTNGNPTSNNDIGAIFGAQEDVAATPGSPDKDDTIKDGPEGEFSPNKIKRRTTYSDANAKWVKAAKKAEKKSGVPNMHLAL